MKQVAPSRLRACSRSRLQPVAYSRSRCGDGAAEAEDVAGEEKGEEDRGGGGGGAVEGGGEALGRAIASALGGVMREFDARAEGAARSQGELALSLDRFTRGLHRS